jgi:hypothetical protein
MSAGDETGPRGMGPVTGRGFGMGWGQGGGWGRECGWRHMYYAIGLPVMNKHVAISAGSGKGGILE